MNEDSQSDPHDPQDSCPADWALFLVRDGSQVVDSLAPLASAATGSPEESDLADYLVHAGVELALAGEILVALERMVEDEKLAAGVLRGDDEPFAVSRLESHPRFYCVVVHPRSVAATSEDLRRCWNWAARAAEKAGGAAKPSPFGSLKILIVDSNPNSLEFGRMMLRKLGCRARTASSVGEALALSKSLAYDLILVDTRTSGMPCSDFMAMLEQRSVDCWGRAPRVLPMRPATRSEEESGREFPGLAKPLGLEPLRAALRDALENRSQALGEADFLDGMDVLELELWGDEGPLLKRLSQTLVNQGHAFFGRSPGSVLPESSLEFAREVYSLKSGADILHARRLSACCQRLLDDLEMGRELAIRQSHARLEEEFERFRLFAVSRGLLSDS